MLKGHTEGELLRKRRPEATNGGAAETTGEEGSEHTPVVSSARVGSAQDSTYCAQ